MTLTKIGIKIQWNKMITYKIILIKLKKSMM